MVPLTRSAGKRIRKCDNSNDDVFKERQTPSRKRARSLDGTQNNVCILPRNISLQYGVRGFINLGASCYINSIIQVLMHTPPLRNYFLLGNHRCDEDHSDVCQMCELSRMFMEYNSNYILPPMSLHRLLYLIWLEVPRLAGLEQQDAHEFYMTYIQLLRRSCIRSTGEYLYTLNPMINLAPCNYIIDQLYAGILQSNLTCLTCRNISTKQEVFCDISLELNALEMEDLYKCLENYTKAENLGESCKIFCPHCEMNREFIKRLSLVVLPNVLNINFKRFTQKGSKQKKLTNHVQFPFDLDMRSFIDECNEGTSGESCHYTLLSVISHDGSMNSGHYTAYVKQADNVWLLCNDHKIKVVTSEVVLKSEAYILVYQRKTYDY